MQIVAVLLCFGFLASFGQAQTCLCANVKFCAHFDGATDVIRGDILAEIEPPSVSGTFTYQVSVKGVYKSQNNIVKGSSITISTSRPCLAVFTVGNHYLLFLYNFETGQCSGNRLWSDTSDLQRLYLHNPLPCRPCIFACVQGYVCRTDSLGVTSCVRPCTLPCPAVDVCVLQDTADCGEYPCQPVPSCENGCVAAGLNCASYQQCVLINGKAYCEDTCNGFPCPSNQQCVLQQPECLVTPCLPIARCVCDQICPDIYIPVCGSNNVTYANSCNLEVANCNLPPGSTPITLEHNGEC